MNYLRWDDLFEYGDKVCSAEQEILMVSVLKSSLKNLCLKKRMRTGGGRGGGAMKRGFVINQSNCCYH